MLTGFGCMLTSEFKNNIGSVVCLITDADIDENYTSTGKIRESNLICCNCYWHWAPSSIFVEMKNITVSPLPILLIIM